MARLCISFTDLDDYIHEYMKKKRSLLCGGVAEWFRAQDLKSGGPWFKSFTLPLSGFVLGNPEFNSSTALSIANWSASDQLGFLTVYVLFEIFGYLFTVSPISTTVLNTYDTSIKLLLLLLQNG